MVGLDMSWVERLGLIMLNMTSKDFCSWLYTRPKSFEILVLDCCCECTIRSSAKQHVATRQYSAITTECQYGKRGISQTSSKQNKHKSGNDYARRDQAGSHGKYHHFIITKD
jgi:hypothetical protein